MSILGKKKKTKKVARDNNLRDLILSQKSPFAIQEAYKALRTNVLFSMVGEGCKIIIVTSSIQGEAKSTTAINLALSFVQNRNKVLLIDGDLRLPTLSTKLRITTTAGLTDLLVGQASLDSVITKFNEWLHFMPAGQIPPNPSELLGSSNMKELLNRLKQAYEYIIIDTPPVCTVTDAAVLSPNATGVLLIVRQGLATKDSVDDAIRQLEMANAKILGFILTDVTNEKTKAYRNKYYKNKYSRYGYSQSYARAQAVQKQSEKPGNVAKKN